MDDRPGRDYRARVLRHALLVIVLAGCKPAEEPPRRPAVVPGGVATRPALGQPAGTVRVTERIGDVSAAPPVIGGVHTPAADALAVNDAADASGSLPDGVAGDLDATPDAGDAAVEWPVRPEDLPADLIASLAAEVPQAARDEARRLNKLGLEAHKKLALDAAEGHYRAALEGFAAFPFARYNLACALALHKRDDEALFHLAVLRHLMDARRDDASRERLEAARVDADFDLLRDDPRFRALTGATGVVVSWVAGTGGDLGKKQAQALVKALREARWPARTASKPWQIPISVSTIRVRGGDPIAEAAAKAIASVLQEASPEASAVAWPVEIGAPLPPEAPPILVIVMIGMPDPLDSEGQPAPAPPDEGSPESEPRAPRPVELPGPDAPGQPAGDAPFATFTDALGKRLRAQRSVTGGVERHQLELKPTGFFAWEVSRPDGVRQRRSGRWSGGESRLLLSYKETTETPSPSDPSAAPAIRVVDGLTSDLRIEVGPRGVVLDGLPFQ